MNSSSNPVLASPQIATSRVTDVMRAVLADRFGIVDQQLSSDQPLESLGLDSLGFVEYVFELEAALKITLPDVPRDIGTVGGLVAFIESEARKQAKGAIPA
jgi:acyl carrier protein